MHTPDVIFPHLGIEIQNLNRTAFTIFGLPIYWYGVLVVLGIGLGICMPYINAKRDVLHADKRTGTPITPDQILDFAFVVIPLAIIGTRLYYVFSMWDNYKNDLLQIFAFRSGGLAIHGAIITSLITAVVYARIKKMNVLRLVDIGIVGLPIGQAIGRVGNFFNQEVFGGYTDSLFAMCYKLDAFAFDRTHITDEMLTHLYQVNGVNYIQVHPTFLYESIWSLATFAFLMLYFNRRKFHGEIMAFYLLLYGVGRFFIESIRTDQLKLFGTSIPSAMVVSAIMAVGALAFMIYSRVRIKQAAADAAAPLYVNPFADAPEDEAEEAAEESGE